ncbi:hypothetical protein [Paraburkholderia tropica]|uniref:hypothetical protein n=1 Tax=Paraburkholderia tropica TaxID=92647 RepID=UPI002ABD94D1|nr:hypothetical protein [Paraburkholderia tropica]
MDQFFISNTFDIAGRAMEGSNFDIQRSGMRRLRLGTDLVMRLNEALANGGKQSVSGVAATLNITATTVWRRERELALRLAKLHAEFVSKEKHEEKEKYREEVVAFIAACLARGVRPNRSSIDIECGGDGRLSTYWKRSILKAAMLQATMKGQPMND